MTIDNSGASSSHHNKRLHLDTCSPKCCRGSGHIPHTHSQAPAQVCGPSRSMASAVPRPFPPPSLSGVPLEYIIDQLRNLAQHYWNRPETADCTIIVPVPHPRRVTPSHPPSVFSPASGPSNVTQYDPSGKGRRATEPNVGRPTLPRIVMKAHLDYLSAHSSFLRSLFSGSSPMDLISSTNSSPIVTHPSRPKTASFNVPANRLPRLLPSSPKHPILYLPVPDPASIHVLFHWIYFGQMDHINNGLHDGTIQWEGIARNVEYLGLSTEIKVFLGKWYSHWLHPERSRPFEDDEDDSDDDCSDSDSDSECDSDDTAYDTALSDLEESGEKKDVEDDDFDDAETNDSATASVADDVSRIDEDEDEDEPWRGRSRATRCLSASYIPSDPPLNFTENRRWSA